MSSTESAQRATKPIFPKLSPGPGGLSPQEVAQHQRLRLQGAMVQAVAKHGYAGTTVRELVTLAGVSKSTFYDHFESKQECFLATFDEIINALGEAIDEAFRSKGEFRERLTASIAIFMNLAVEEPAAASLAAVESLTLGAAGVEHRDRASRTFEVLLKENLDSSPAKRKVSERTVKAIVDGIRGVAYRWLRAGRSEELPGLVDELVEWAISYQAPESKMTTSVAAAAEVARPPREKDAGDERPDWSEPPDSRLSRSTLTQGERIARAAARVAVERGYDALSIPVITGAAGVSNQTFYQHFSSKRDAFLNAFDLLGAEALDETTTVFEGEGDRPEAIGAKIRAMLEFIAGNELYARLAFFELAAAGPVALNRADEMMESFMAFLEPEAAPSPIDVTLPESIRIAVPTGIWSVIQNEIAEGRRESLPELAPEIARIAMAPFDARTRRR